MDQLILKRKRFIDTGLFVEWEVANFHWARIKDANIVYSLGSYTYKWFIFYPVPDTLERVTRQFPSFSIDVGPNFLSTKHVVSTMYKDSYYINAPSEEVLDILLKTLPPDLQTKLIFNIDLFK